MKNCSMLERLLPHIVHAAMTAAVIVLSVDILKKVNHINKDAKILGEKHGLLKLIYKQHEEHNKEKENEKK